MLRAKRILVPLNLSPGEEKVVKAAAAMAAESRGRLCLFHVFDSRAVEDVFHLHGLKEEEVRERMRAGADEYIDRLRGRAWLKGISVDVLYATGLPPEEIVTAAREWKADLVVLSRSRRSGLAHLLYGRTSDGVVREASCAVLVLAP